MTNEQISDAIRQSTAVVFATMLNLEVSPGDLSQQTDPPPLNGVMALLGFTGEWLGTGVFYCQESLACRVSSVMMLNKICEINNDVLDAVGELANMVLGNFKDKLEPFAGPLAMSIPTVVYGRNFQTRPAHRNWLIVPFSVGDDIFEVRVCLAPRNNRSS